jgi:peptidoglycan/LPS O-acetylase OafA/YrhL
MLAPMSPPTGFAGARGWIRRALRVALLPNHYPPLHGLRVLAIISVVQIHITGALARGGLIPMTPIWFLSFDLWFAMDLFFLMSGFLIGSLLLAELPDGRQVNVGRFYVRRIFRTVPPYVAVLTLLALTMPLTMAQHRNLWREYAYLTNYVPPEPERVVMPWGWSLAMEEHFYLLVPFFLGTLRSIASRKGQLVFLVLVWASALVLRTWVYTRRSSWDVVSMANVFFVQSHLRFDILVAGIFTAWVQRYHEVSLAERLRRWPFRWLLAGLSLAGFALLLLTGHFQRNVLAYNLLCWGTVTSLAYVPLVLLVLNRESALSRFLSHASFAHLAALSYGIYLLHVPIIRTVLLPMATHAKQAMAPPALLLWAVMLGAALGLATLASYVLHLVVEKPALLLRDRLTTKVR